LDISERSLDLRGNLVVPEKDMTLENKLKKRKERKNEQKRMKMKNSLIFSRGRNT